MSILFTCRCGKTYALDESARGKNVRCSSCGSTATVSNPTQCEAPRELPTYHKNHAAEGEPQGRHNADSQEYSDVEAKHSASSPVTSELSENTIPIRSRKRSLLTPLGLGCGAILFLFMILGALLLFALFALQNKKLPVGTIQVGSIQDHISKPQDIAEMAQKYTVYIEGHWEEQDLLVNDTEDWFGSGLIVSKVRMEIIGF